MSFKEQKSSELVAPSFDLGIIDLDDRFEFSIDPISHIVVPNSVPKQPPTNGNCSVCATNIAC